MNKFLTLRGSVQEFAARMEQKLRKHDHNRGDLGWQDESLEYLLGRLADETKELYAAYSDHVDDVTDCKAYRAIRKEAVDIGNFAMMISDVCEMEMDAWGSSNE